VEQGKISGLKAKEQERHSHGEMAFELAWRIADLDREVAAAISASVVDDVGPGLHQGLQPTLVAIVGRSRRLKRRVSAVDAGPMT